MARVVRGVVGVTLPVLKIGLRLGLAGGAVYVTKEAGVWGDTRQGAAAMARVQRGLTMEEVEAFCGEDCPILPALRKSKRFYKCVTKHLDNYMGGVVEVPAEVSALTTSLGDSARDINKNFYSYYNLGVVAALDGVRALPDTTGKYAAQAVEAVKGLAK